MHHDAKKCRRLCTPPYFAATIQKCMPRSPPCLCSEGNRDAQPKEVKVFPSDQVVFPASARCSCRRFADRCSLAGDKPLFSAFRPFDGLGPSAVILRGRSVEKRSAILGGVILDPGPVRSKAKPFVDDLPLRRRLQFDIAHAGSLRRRQRLRGQGGRHAASAVRG
jgi:hypothetical protein